MLSSCGIQSRREQLPASAFNNTQSVSIKDTSWGINRWKFLDCIKAIIPTRCYFSFPFFLWNLSVLHTNECEMPQGSWKTNIVNTKTVWDQNIGLGMFRRVVSTYKQSVFDRGNTQRLYLNHSEFISVLLMVRKPWTQWEELGFERKGKWKRVRERERKATLPSLPLYPD